MGTSRRSLRRAVPATAVAALLLWGVLACVGPGPVNEPRPTVTADGGPAIVPLPTDHLRPIPLLTTAPDDAERLTWHLLSQHDGGRRLALSVDARCGSIIGSSVTETRDQVTVTVYGPASRLCTLSKTLKLRSVTLPHPLGGRELRHG